MQVERGAGVYIRGEVCEGVWFKVEDSQAVEKGRSGAIGDRERKIARAALRRPRRVNVAVAKS